MQEAGIAVGGASQGHLLVGGSRSVTHGVQVSQTYRELCGNVGMPCETGLAFVVAAKRQGACSVVLGHGDAFRFVLTESKYSEFVPNNRMPIACN